MTDDSTGPWTDHAESLLGRAEGGAQMLADLHQTSRTPDWGLGFHAQQAVEKAIKAVLTCNQVKYPHTHDLVLLLNLLAHHGLPLPPKMEVFPLLTPFGTVMRYESLPTD